MQINQRRVLGLERPQQVIVPHFHVGIVGNIHVLRTGFLSQLGKIPQFNGAIQAAAHQNVAAPTERQAVYGFLVSRQLGHQMAVRQIPDKDSAIGSRRSQESAAYAKGESLDRLFMACH